MQRPRMLVLMLLGVVAGCGDAVREGAPKEPREPLPEVASLHPTTLVTSLRPLLEAGGAGCTARFLRPADLRRMCAGAPREPLERAISGCVGSVELRAQRPGDVTLVLRITEATSPEAASAFLGFLRREADLPRGPQVPTRLVTLAQDELEVDGASGFYEEKRIHWKEVHLRLTLHGVVVRRGRRVIELRRRKSLISKDGILRPKIGERDADRRRELTALMRRVLGTAAGGAGS